jgi:hypothetical protein
MFNDWPLDGLPLVPLLPWLQRWPSLHFPYARLTLDWYVGVS